MGRSNQVLGHLLLAGILAGSASARAQEPLKINADLSTVPSSVRSEIAYFMGRDNVVTNLQEIEKMGRLTIGQINQDVWSDSYWNDIQGGIAAPYADSSAMGMFLPFGNLRVTGNMELFYSKHAVLWDNTAALTDEQIEMMSPAEKYDLLVGDSNFTLSRTVWEGVDFLHHNKPKFTASGQFIYDKNGNMLYEPKRAAVTPFWQGICNGWAVAALNLDRPLHSFVLTNTRGQRIKFYPTDVQALASQLWARSYINGALDGNGPDAKPVIRHSGYRCNTGTISRDLWTGRAKNPACNDVNPGVWHLAVLNRVGIDKEGFIADTRTADSVWNHPIKSYNYSYFNVLTGDYGSLERAKTPVDKVSDFSKFRAPGTKYIIGVEMTANFLNNIDAEVREKFTSEDDRAGEETYTYDLELDANDNVIGGEWRINGRPDPTRVGDSNENRNPNRLDHPDFIWAPLSGWKAFAIGDRLMGVDYGTWDGNGAVPPGIRSGAVQSSKVSQPLAEIVDLLISHSRK